MFVRGPAKMSVPFPGSASAAGAPSLGMGAMAAAAASSSISPEPSLASSALLLSAAASSASPRKPSRAHAPLYLAVPPARLFAQYDFALLPGTHESRSIAWLSNQMEYAAEQSDTIAGGTMQFDLAPPSSGLHQNMTVRWDAEVRNAMLQLGFSEEQLKAMEVVTPKLLVSAPGKGEQLVHWDDTEPSADKITILLAVSNGVHSTFLPRFAREQLQPIVLPKAEDGVTEDEIEAARAQMRKNAYLLDKSFYHNIPMLPGDMLVLRHTVSHYAPPNTLKGALASPRVMLFSMLASDLNPAQDKYQRFMWHYVYDAFGAESPEYAQALIDCKAEDPILTRFGYEDAIEAIDCLVENSRFTDYFGDKTTRAAVVAQLDLERAKSQGAVAAAAKRGRKRGTAAAQEEAEAE